jgi:hypothetical protein
MNNVMPREYEDLGLRLQSLVPVLVGSLYLA